MGKSGDKLRILMLEDSPSDARLIQHALKREGLDHEVRVVETKSDFIAALEDYQPHLILSDHSLVGFDSREALEVVQKSSRKIPFILVTGTVSEEYAVSIIKAGAADYILKSNLSRLTVAIRSAISQQEDREKLKESEAQFQQTIDGMVDGVQIIGFDWTYLYVNHAVAHHAKTTRENLLGRTMMEVFPGIEDTHMFSELRRCMTEREDVIMENEFVYPDGSKGWFKLTMQPATPGVLILSRDITEDKKIIELLESQNKRIKMVNSALDRFLYSVSHEFRTPICNGLGLINLLRRNGREEDRLVILGKLQSSIRNLDELLQSIGMFSEISSVDVAYTEVNLRKVFNESLEQARQLEGSEQVDVQLRLNEQVPLFTDPKHLSIVISNLLSNGIRFRDPRKKSFVEVHASVTPLSAHLEVRDNGMGIKEEYIDKIFDVFYTGGDTNKGRGLGLFMVREIVEKLSGNFSVKSMRDAGTTFYITLPNARPDVELGTENAAINKPY